MADAVTETPESDVQSDEPQLEQGTYEIIQGRLRAHADELAKRLDKLNHARREVFGSIETKLLATERITSTNNCVPRDLVPIGAQFVFGYNVHLGLKSETDLADVFSVYRFEDGTFHEQPLELISDATFLAEFKQLYKYYKSTTFAKFQVIGPHLYMVFRVGKSVNDIKAFKWLIDGEQLRYLDNRSDHEVTYPAQHEFAWTRTHRDLHRTGAHPHISIEDRLFVETVGGDLTIKIEDNTDDGEGIYGEPVDDPDQVLDDAEIFYAIVGNIILLKIRPYREQEFRYLVYNEKVKQAQRLDSIADACVLLPEDHGLIFSNGYYLQTGESKIFESQIRDLVFEKRIVSPNGEDYQFVFHNRETGDYVLLSYNLIEQRVDNPVTCSGFSFFENGNLVLFRAEDSPQKHHALQIWQTPYVGHDYQAHAQTDAFLFKIGNKDIVRAMSEATAVINLIRKDDSYENLYVDLVKATTDLIDSYFWLESDEAFDLRDTVASIRDAANAAVDEFDRVVRVRRNTEAQFHTVSKATREAITAAGTRMYQQIDDFVSSLAEFRRMRGELISLRELKYIDLAAVEELEQTVDENSGRVSHRCVQFLLRDDALAPYEQKVQEQRDRIPDLAKTADARKLDEEIAGGSGELEMLIDIVSNLKIDDATQRTRIIDDISGIYSKLNQARAALKKKNQELLSDEGIAEFNSQLKLLGQAVVNYLDVCDTPEKCDEYLTKMMVQIEELEGKFAEFDDFVLQLAEKREEIYAAFDTRKIGLVEARNRRATTLQNAADRILSGIRTRVANFDTINEINSYFASDLMIEKVRDICEQLGDLDDSVKVDDIQSRLKTIREDAVRQLKDRNELFVDGKNVIKFGKHQFSVNVQPLDLTMVIKDAEMFFHLTGTKFMESVDAPEMLATREVWEQELISENSVVYRGEYLAYLLMKEVHQKPELSFQELLELTHEDLVSYVQKFMGPRYSEGYVKGVHDHDAASIFRSLIELETTVGPMRYHPSARGLANVVWAQMDDQTKKHQLTAKIDAFKAVAELFPYVHGRQKYIDELALLLGNYVDANPIFDRTLVEQASTFLFEELVRDERSVSQHAVTICRGFGTFLERKSAVDKFDQTLAAIDAQDSARYLLLRDWLNAYLEEAGLQEERDYLDEAASVLLDQSVADRQTIDVEPARSLTGMLGSHPLIEEDRYELAYNDFLLRLRRFEAESVPAYESYQELKKTLAAEKREQLRLEEFKPRVLTSFVRNKLINDVYLPLIGDNLAKQIGVIGENKRTDLMGLLLLISPPGYGKTTLMEYVANRLGITFMKINGPAIGHQVTSLDPEEANNASAREEVEKLNLALEMGDNVMIYLDDIQHCNPEFLQKFISLCDGTRRIEGVYQGKTRTYDLRGRKVCVVMAGNPYTESGDKFQIPDMLANRADTYNLGDVVGDSSNAFELSYLENSLTSNRTLSVLQSRSRNDIYSIIQMAQEEQATGLTLEANYSVEEINELTAVMRKLIRVRDVLLKVNQLYIESAAQADAYRTEPPFKLQGSYRDMNKIAERILPVMNDEELATLIDAHFQNQAQTLTTGAEANLLKFKELIDEMSEEEEARWSEIKRTFKRNLVLGGAAGDDKFGQVIAQMTTISEGLHEIKLALDEAHKVFSSDSKQRKATGDSLDEQVAAAHLRTLVDQFSSFGQSLSGIHEVLVDGVQATAKSAGEAQRIEVVNRVPRTFLEVIKAQFAILAEWVEPITKMSESAGGDFAKLQATMEETLNRYEQLASSLHEYGDAPKRPSKSKGTAVVIEAESVSADDNPQQGTALEAEVVKPVKKTTRKKRGGKGKS